MPQKCLHNLFIHANLVRLLIFIVDINIMMANKTHFKFKNQLEEKKYKCDHCRKKFKTEIFLKKYIKVLHNQGRKNYDYVEIGKDFSNQLILGSNDWIHHFIHFAPLNILTVLISTHFTLFVCSLHKMVQTVFTMNY